MTAIPSTPPSSPRSPWHAGEVALQAQLGVAQRMAAFGPHIFRDQLPGQHRQFYAQLPWLLFGAVDAQGWPWASVLEGEPGFLHSPEPRSLRIDALAAAGDPALAALAPGGSVGLLGIELATRRRNRLNGVLSGLDAGGMTVSVQQAFGNCPQYIQAREFAFARPPAAAHDVTVEDLGPTLDDAARALIAHADTFFVASYVDVVGDAPGDAPQRQVDVSHRGGLPGFVRIDRPPAGTGGDTLTIPDFAGNLHFNTLGNLLLQPRAGLLFIDFTTGDVLQLAGGTEIVMDGDEVARFAGAQRLWRVTVQHAVRRRRALALRFGFSGYAPTSLGPGPWRWPAAGPAPA